MTRFYSFLQKHIYTILFSAGNSAASNVSIAMYRTLLNPQSIDLLSLG